MNTNNIKISLEDCKNDADNACMTVISYIEHSFLLYDIQQTSKQHKMLIAHIEDLIKKRIPFRDEFEETFFKKALLKDNISEVSERLANYVRDLFDEGLLTENDIDLLSLHFEVALQNNKE